MKIKGYTLHGDYYFSDEIITTLSKNWNEALKIKEEIVLPNGKKVIAHTLSKKELESIPSSERIGYLNNGSIGWYWTSTLNDTNDFAWLVSYDGDFISLFNSYSSDIGGVRLGFHKNEIK